jgi:hypothetical protein
MVDDRGLEVDIFLSRGRGAAGSQHRETSDQLSTAERTVLEAGQKIGNDRFHGDFLSLEKWGWQQDCRA